MKEKHFYVAMYLRLSKDDNKDGKIKFESDSIGNQRELIKAYIREQSDMELYDIYVDDGFSGSNYNRPEFKRMIADVGAGRVNCIIVKDLSRFGRDYIESGRYIQKVFPALGVRFIALTDHYDSFLANSGESSIVLPVKNFINDSYCRDISIKVKSGLEVKRKNGDCISPFAVYGYLKDKNNKNHLVIDEYAAENIKLIFKWKIEGFAISAIADKLNSLGILSPREYKKSIGIRYHGGFSGSGASLWSSSTVKRILTNEVYLGHMIQGKTQKVNYKVKKNIEKPRAEWVRVENTHEAIITADEFEIVQNLLQSDSRVSPDMKGVGLFSGLLYCADCKEHMIRRVVRYREKSKVYYICSTKNRGDGCSRHSVVESQLIEAVNDIVKKYTNAFLEQKLLFDRAIGKEVNFEAIVRYDKEIERLRKEQDKYYRLCSGLYEDLRKGVITKEEFERLYEHFQQKKTKLGYSQEKQETLIKDMFKKGVVSDGWLKAFQASVELKELDRCTLCSLVKRIYVHENMHIWIEFYFADEYEIMLNRNRAMANGKIVSAH